MLAQQLSVEFGPQLAAKPLQLLFTVHAPALHMALGQAQVVSLQAPAALQDCAVLPVHCLPPGTHIPWHEPFTQAVPEVVHDVAAP